MKMINTHSRLPVSYDRGALYRLFQDIDDAANTATTRLTPIVNTKDFGAAPGLTEAQNKTALQSAITYVNTYGGGVIVIDYDIDYGVKTRTASTWPSFSGITKPILIHDYSRGSTQDPTVYPTAYDGMQYRVWSFTPQTTSFGQHDGNTQWLRGQWAPVYCVSNDGDLAAVGHASRLASDNRRCGYATMVDGEASWQLISGTLTGAGYTDEEMSNLALQKFAITGDTLGAYTPYNVERKTGNVSYGGGRNIPSAHHHFEAVTSSPTLDLVMLESKGVTCTEVLRNSNGSGDDVSIANQSGNLALRIPAIGSVLTFNKTTRRGTFAKALQQVLVSVTYSASMTPNSDDGNIFRIIATNGTAFTINAPSGTASAGQKITVRIVNSSGGALGTVTWNASYTLLTSWTQPANGASSSITFYYDDSVAGWVEISRAPVVAASVAGSDTQIQFNDGGAFGGDAGLTWDKTNNILYIGVIADSTGYIGTASAASGNTNGNTLNLFSGTGFGSGSGGNVTLGAGEAGATGTGGQLSFSAGNGGATSGNGGQALMQAGDAGASGTGGNATLKAGAGTNTSAGGNAIVQAGTSGASGRPGHVVLNGLGAALATTATGGFTCIPTCAGAPTGVPASVPTGNAAMVYDTTNNRIYIYNGAWRMVAVV